MIILVAVLWNRTAHKTSLHLRARSSFLQPSTFNLQHLTCLLLFQSLLYQFLTRNSDKALNTSISIKMKLHAFNLVAVAAALTVAAPLENVKLPHLYEWYCSIY